MRHSVLNNSGQRINIDEALNLTLDEVNAENLVRFCNRGRIVLE